MALIKCPECGKEISDKSRTCIQSGYPSPLIFICPAVVFDCVYCIFLKREIDYHKSVKANPDLYKEVMLASIIECPYCHSTDTTKITTASKAVHTAFFGIFSMSRNSKQWHCNDCGSDF